MLRGYNTYSNVTGASERMSLSEENRCSHMLPFSGGIRVLRQFCDQLQVRFEI